MSLAEQELKALVVELAAQLLKKVAVFFELHASLLLFKKNRKVHTSKIPALCALLDGARKAFEQSIQKSFEHEGLICWLRVAVPMTKMMLFQTPTAPNSITFALCGSEREFGHEPP